MDQSDEKGFLAWARVADAEAAAAREAVHREEARRQKKKHDEELARLAEQKRLNDAEAQEALEAREALRQSSLLSPRLPTSQKRPPACRSERRRQAPRTIVGINVVTGSGLASRRVRRR